MPHYVTLMKWTSQGRMGLPAWRDRVEEGERMIEDAGGKLVGVWVTLGQYDVVEVFEAPTDETALEIITKLQRHGAEQTETLRAFTRDEAADVGPVRDVDDAHAAAGQAALLARGFLAVDRQKTCALDAGPRGIERPRSARVAGAVERQCLDAEIAILRDAHARAAVLERARGILAFILEPQIFMPERT